MKTSRTETRYLARDMEPELQVVRSKGSYIFDERGKRYIDFVMGWCVGNLGWGNPVLERKAATFKGPDYVYPGYRYQPWIDLAELLARIAPGDLTKTCRATGGSEAVDIALQAAMLHTGRGAFVAIEDSYHGNSIAGMSVAASENREKIPSLLPNCRKIDPPLDANALDRVETQLKRRDVAAVILEPISINLGVLVPDNDFMSGLSRLCKRFGTLLICDEVATGFGRTGRLFATEYFDAEPDIMCVAKAITGGVGGMGATIMTEDVASSLEEDGSFYSTYGWHPRSTHVAIATVQYIIDHREKLLDHVTRMSDLCMTRLREMDFDEECDIRARGLAIGIDVGDEDYADNIGQRARRKGLLVSTEGETVLLLPPLNVERSVVERAMDILSQCLTVS